MNITKKIMNEFFFIDGVRGGLNFGGWGRRGDDLLTINEQHNTIIVAACPE